MTRAHVLIALIAAIALSACSLGGQSHPPLTGPSEFALSLQITATPDVIAQDGKSQVAVAIVARDAAGQPAAPLQLRLDMTIDGLPADFGTLSSHWLSTGIDGRASATYTAPPPPPPIAESDVLLTFSVRAVGGNYAGSSSRTATIRLTPPTVIR